MRQGRAAIALAWILAATLVAPAWAATTAPSGPVPARATASLAGLDLVDDEVYQPRVAPEDRADWDKLTELVFESPEEFGFPWMDETSHVARVAVATTKGEEAAVAFANSPDLAIKVEISSGATSIAELDALADGLTRLDPKETPDAGLLWMTEPDYLNNRIIASIDHSSEALASALASKFGSSHLAIRIAAQPNIGSTYDRDNDTPAFFGGAKITVPVGGCTTAFAWNASGGTGEMVMAGHCAPNGGNVSYPGYSPAGSVASGSEENWSSTTGTVYFPGQTTYRGDVALIRYSGQSSNYYVYDGALHSSTHHKDVAMLPGYAVIDDPICVNGAYSAEHCGKVRTLHINAWYNLDGPNVWIRNATRMDPTTVGDCTIHGDSGGPVYQRRADGTLTAYGITSGREDGLFGSCVMYFTDMRLAYFGIPGSLLVP